MQKRKKRNIHTDADKKRKKRNNTAAEKKKHAIG